MKNIFSSLFLFFVPLFLLAFLSFTENIALGAKYTLDPVPNYTHCKDESDAIQLTDGKYVEGHFWTQQGTVGWSETGFVLITIDLEKDMPISGVSFSTAGGLAGVKFPDSIVIFTAGEDDIFHEVGDLIKLNNTKKPVPSAGYATYRYTIDKLQTHGRKIALLVFGEPYIFCDEIEVWKGKEEDLSRPLPGMGFKDLRKYVNDVTIHNCVKKRITNDIGEVQKIAGNVKRGKKIQKELNKLIKEIDTLPLEYPENFKTIFPINSTHEKVFKLYARTLQAEGLKGLTAWRSHPYQYTELFPSLSDIKPTNTNQLYLGMMQNEFRSVAFNVISPKNAEVAIEILGISEGLRKECIKVQKVLWTDTKRLEPVASALMPINEEEGLFKLNVLAGLTQQVWITVYSKNLPPNTYNMEIKVNQIRLPMTLKIYPIHFPDRPALHMGGWDYTNVSQHYEVTEANRTALVNMLREYFVDSPWATSVAMPFGSYDDFGTMTEPPDTSNFDAWRKLWKDARRYCVFSAVRNKFQQWEIGTPEFNKAVGNWAKFWDNYMRNAGLDPSQLIVLLVDEPHQEQEDTIIKAWAKAIHTSGAGFQIWEDPIYRDMTKALPEMIAECDILCPNRQLFYKCGEDYRQFFIDQRDQGRKLEFYSCSGPMRLLDPTTYCRLQAWDCWRYGAEATYFWAFADAAGNPSWNEYLNKRHAYTPLFIDKDTVYPGKHLEAMCEGIEDYEYLNMLEKAIKEGKCTEETRTQAETLLQEIRNTLHSIMPESGILFWKDFKQPEIIDNIREKILQTLLSLTTNN